MAIHAGSWLGLPDFGVTEAIGSLFNAPRTAQGGSNLLGGNNAQAPAPTYNTSTGLTGQGGQAIPNNIFGTPSTQGTLGAATSTSRIPTNNVTSGPQATTSLVQSNQDNGNNQIEADYNSAMAALNDQEGGLRSQAGAATGQIDTGAAQAKNEITNNQAVATQGTNTSLQTAEKQGTSAMQQARDLFRQTQQQNGAQLSALGISSSSVAEALAERLGVETARRIAGVTGSLDEVRQNAVNELGRIKTYYTGKLTDVDNQVRDQKAVIQNSLISGLNQINSARNTAANAKSQSRANLMQQVQDQLGSLAQQQQQFQQALDMWQAQKSAALTPIVQDPNYVNKLLSNTQTLQQNFSPTGFQFVPSLNVDKNGVMTGQISPKKPYDPNNDLSTPNFGP